MPKSLSKSGGNEAAKKYRKCYVVQFVLPIFLYYVNFSHLESVSCGGRFGKCENTNKSAIHETEV
jgi:hypothetical protein